MCDTTLLQLALALTPPWTVSRSDFDPDAHRCNGRCPLPHTATRFVPTNPADTHPQIPPVAARRPVWCGRPHVNGCAVPAAVVEPTARVTCVLGTAPFRPPSLTKQETEVQMCRVLNKHATGGHDGAIYIGRGSKRGNPFRIGADGDRATAGSIGSSLPTPRAQPSPTRTRIRQPPDSPPSHNSYRNYASTAVSAATSRR